MILLTSGNIFLIPLGAPCKETTHRGLVTEMDTRERETERQRERDRERETEGERDREREKGDSERAAGYFYNRRHSRAKFLSFIRDSVLLRCRDKQTRNSDSVRSRLQAAQRAECFQRFPAAIFAQCHLIVW